MSLKTDELMAMLPELLKLPDQDGNAVNFVSVGVDVNGHWQVCRWWNESPANDNGPIGSANNLDEALIEAFKRAAKTDEEKRCYVCGELATDCNSRAEALGFDECEWLASK